jgi:hypothetical protein
MKPRDPCAMCARFTTKGHEQQASMGLGFCVGYEVYVRADAPPTVLFKPAPAGQIAERRAFLEQHKEKETA